MNQHPNTQGLPAFSYHPADTDLPLIEGTIGDALLLAATRFGSNCALVDGQADQEMRRRWSFADLAREAAQVAHALRGHFEPGQCVAIWAGNCPEWMLVELGAALAGIVLVTVNPAYQEHELTHVLRQSRAAGIILQDSHRGRNLADILEAARSELPELKTVIKLSDWDSFLASASPCSLPRVQPRDIAQIQYTSGTTGFPKGACLTHLGLSNNGRLFAETIAARPGDKWINAMPMFHTAGCGLATLGALQTGGTQIMVPGFDAELMLDLFETEGGTISLCVPTMLIRMIEEQQRAPRNISSWRLVTLGGAPVPAELVRKAQNIMGVEVGIGFGQTEASPYLTHTLPDDRHPEWFETVGKPLPHTEVKIVDPATGAILPVGTQGEICGRGYGLMTGYFDAPDATSATIDTDGWLHTGDVGSMDERGYCRIQGRLRDMIIRGGENIYPREVEDILLTHPAIADIAVIGLPDPEWGESVAACIRLADPGQPAPAELEAFCRQRMAGFKVPRQWHVMESFPQTASGKIQKFVLRDMLLAAANKA